MVLPVAVLPLLFWLMGVREEVPTVPWDGRGAFPSMLCSLSLPPYLRGHYGNTRTRHLYRKSQRACQLHGLHTSCAFMCKRFAFFCFFFALLLYECNVSLCPSCTLFINAGLCCHLWWWLYPWQCCLPRLQTWLCVPWVLLHARCVDGEIQLCRSLCHI